MVQRLFASALATACALGVGVAALEWQSSAPLVSRPLVAAGHASAAAVTPADAGELLRSRPLAFERNVGQYPGAAPFVSRGAGYLLSLQPTEARLHLQAPAPGSRRTPRRHASPRPDRPSRFRQADVRMTIVGANPAAAGRAEGPREARSNYFLGADPAKWRTNVQHFDGVRFDAVYPGIDVVYYGRQSTLEYDFIVQPGTRPEVIELAFDGARRVRLLESGDLVLETALGEVRQHAPVIYQERDGRREPIEGRYVRRGQRSVGFEVDDYDPARVLVIDPVLEYSTYLGGSGNDYAMDVAVDGAGAMYVLGVTPGTVFPAVGGFDTSPNGGADIFVAKFSAAGTLLFSTFFGGGGEDTTDAFAVDSAGNVYVAGNITGDVPTTAGAYQTVRNNADIVVFKLSSAGNALAYSTYLGSGAEPDQIWTVGVDAAGSAYVGGGTNSAAFPTTVGAWDRSYNNLGDGFLTKFNPAGSGLQFSTFLGGTNTDEIRGLAVHPQGRIFVTGTTLSCDYPVTGSAADTSCNGGSDAFITVVEPTGAQLAISTYLGGSATDVGWDIVAGANGEATVAGYTTSPNLPAAVNSPLGGTDGYVARLRPGGAVWDFVRYVGGSGADYAWALAVDGAGAAFLAGATSSTNFPTTPGTFNYRPSGGGQDGFLTKVNQDGVLDYSTYLGTRASDTATAVALDPFGRAYLAGWTFTTGLTTAFPVTANGAYRTGNGDYDAFLMRFAPPIDRHLQVGVTNAIAIPAGSFVESFADLTGAFRDAGIIERVTVSAHVTHPFDSDLSLNLIGPDGASVLLTQDNGGSGADYGVGCRDGERTTFDDAAATSITTGNAPFRGTFRPQAPLSIFAGRNATGRWRLRATDFATRDTGVLRCWTLHIQFRAPTINSILPTAGRTSGGVFITISGGNFVPDGDVEPTVRIGGVPVIRTGGTGISFNGQTGPRYAGPADVVVTDSYGRSTVARDAFTYEGPRQLTVSGAGAGAGTVTTQAGFAPAISCSYSGGQSVGTCVQNYEYATSVVLTATPTLGSTFTGWTGACTNVTGACTVPMTIARSVTATFAGPSQTLTVNGGPGTGVITSQAGLTPAISCTITNGVASGFCSRTYPSGTSVTLTMLPASGSDFTGWSNACTGTGTCTVAMTAARTATAGLTPPPPTLTITGSGAGSGVITSQAGLSPAINCRISNGAATGVCSRTYPLNTSITLSVVAGSASVFDGWSGACSGVGACTVVMSQARRVSASFDGTAQTRIETMTPARGSTAGGTLVTIRGSGFVPGSMGVAMDGTAITSVRVIDSQTMTFVTPPSTAHTANMQMTGPGGSAGGSFVYEVPEEGSIAGARNARFDYAGRYLVFESDVALVADDTNGVADIYVVDRRNPTAAPVRLSVTSQKLQAIGGESVTPAISSTGRLVAFASRATNLVPADGNGLMDIFVHDRDADGDGTFDELDAVSTTRVSLTGAGVEADGASAEPTISGSGRWVAFTSTARNLGAGTSDSFTDVFVRDRAIGATAAVTNGSGASAHPVISLDGRFIAFQSESPSLVSGDTNTLMDVFLHDRDTDEDGVLDETGARATTAISVSSAGALALGGASRNPSITQEGRWTVFESEATNLVANDTNGVSDIFIHDRIAHTTTRLSQTPQGTQDTRAAVNPVIAANGSRVHYVRNPSASGASFARAGVVGAAAGSEFGDEVELPDPTNPNPPPPPPPNPDAPPTSTPCLSGNGQANCDEVPPPGPGAPPEVEFEGDPEPPPDAVAPVIFDWSSRRGYWNQQAIVDVQGHGFTASSRVFVEGQEMETELRGQSLRFRLPALDPPPISSSIDRRFEVRNGALASNSAVFSYDPTPGSGGPPALSNPIVDGLTVTSGSSTGNTSVTVQGSGFSAATVLVDGMAVTPGTASATALTFQTPPHPAGVVAVAVRNGDGVVAASQPPFRYVLEATALPLVVTAVGPAPALAAGQSSFTITGQNFAPGATVTVANVPATQVVVASTTQIQAVAPPMPAGVVVEQKVPVTVTIDGRTATLADVFYYTDRDPFVVPSSDADGDGLPAAWETAYGLSDATPTDAALDPDNDGRTSAQEYGDGTHPLSRYTRYFAEGASGPYFTTRLSLANPNASPATVLMRVLTDTGASLPKFLVVPAMSTKLVTVDHDVPGAGEVAFATIIESDVEIVADRTMFWDDRRFGSSAETSLASPALTWYLAEGATGGNFYLFYLLQNPSLTETSQVRIRYLRPTRPPVERVYTVGPRSRLTIQVDDVPGLEDDDVSGVIEVTNNVPVIAERAMYAVDPANLALGFVAGHESAGVTALSTQWFLAEGATGPFFDFYILLANPNPQAADLRVTYLLDDGTNIEKSYGVPANARRTIYVNGEDARLAQVATATKVESINGVPIVVERAMWWPHGAPAWQEAHNSAGSTITGEKWGLAEGETARAQETRTYILIANTASTTAQVRVTLLFEPGQDPVSIDVPVLPNSRRTIDVAGQFPASTGRSFGAIVESLNGEPIVVERAMYSNALGVTWAAGTNALATKLR
jgi:Tol biopolymer transport system component/subtilisin-like proprotein convertase family protein